MLFVRSTTTGDARGARPQCDNGKKLCLLHWGGDVPLTRLLRGNMSGARNFALIVFWGGTPADPPIYAVGAGAPPT